MEIVFNMNDNGACPLCKKRDKCSIQEKIKESVKNISSNDNIETVIYKCPLFEE